MHRIIQIMAILSVVVSSSSYGTPYVIASEHWDSDTAGWAVTTDPVTTPIPTLENTGVNAPDHALLFTYTDSSVPAVARLFTSTAITGSEKFLGNFNAAIPTTPGYRLGVEFKLRTESSFNSDPNSMWLYFVGGVGNHTYYYNGSMTQPNINVLTFTPYSFVIGSQANWLQSDPYATGWNFTDDFGSVTEFGIGFLGSSDAGSRKIYLDDFEIKVLVPEPETVWMMVMVLASLALTFRGRLTDLGNQVKARFAA